MSAKLRRAAPVTCMSLAVIAVAAISGSAQARTAAGPSPGVAGIDRAPQFTGLAASFLTHPQPVRGTDGRFHIAYELMLTDTTPPVLTDTIILSGTAK